MTTIAMKKGSTLSATVRSYNKAHGTHLTVAQVAKQNHLKDANKIQAGQKIHIGDRFETRKPAPVSTKPVTTAPAQTRPNNPVLDLRKNQQEQMNKLFPKEPFKLTPFKLDPNYKPRNVDVFKEMREKTQQLTKKPDFKIEPFKLKF